MKNIRQKLRTGSRIGLSLGSCLAVGILSFSLSSQAQKVKVEKVKGNKAIVVFSGAPLETGKVYDLGAKGASSQAMNASGGQRDRIIGLSATISSLTITVSGSSSTETTTGMGFLGRYGWNLGKTEFGFLAEFTSASTGSVTATTFGGGGFFDYDLVENRPGVEFVYGLGGQAILRNISTGIRNYSSWEVYPEGFLKWFVLPTTTCLRFDAGLRYRNDMSTPNAVTYTGLVMLMGLDHYF